MLVAAVFLGMEQELAAAETRWLEGDSLAAPQECYLDILPCACYSSERDLCLNNKHYFSLLVINYDVCCFGI